MRLFTLALTFFALAACKSDQTIKREDVKIGAVYQEYELNYSAPDRSFVTKVFFKTSSSGDYIKLSATDEIGFTHLRAGESDYFDLRRSETQIYLGSRNVPVYIRKVSREFRSGDEVGWYWYDSESGETFLTNTTVTFPMVTLNEAGAVVDTTKEEGITIRLSTPLEKNQTLRIVLQGISNHIAGFSFVGGTGETFYKISADALRKSLQPSPARPEDGPVDIRGRHRLSASMSVSSSEKARNTSKRGGKVKKTISYASATFEVII